MATSSTEVWPALPWDDWKDTCATLQLWTQIVGKIRMAQTPLVNHWWNVTLYVTTRGLTTSPMPYGDRYFEIDFDFLAHQLIIRTCEGDTRSLPLAARSVAAFYRDLMSVLQALGLPISINTQPQEITDGIRFPEDEVHASYDAELANRFWRILFQTDKVLKAFRARFIGKVSPVHFFWGGFDLAVTRFSGRLTAPPSDDAMTREAYSHEVISHGFWPGDSATKSAAFYAYGVPEPDGLASQIVHPASVLYRKGMPQFVLLYDDVRTAANPAQTLTDFCQSTYDAIANLAGWDRAALERGRK